MPHFSLPDLGLLRLSGETHFDFLQRQTSNDLRRLAADACLQTVLTSATGRILDVLTLWHGAQGLNALTLPGRGDATAGFLQSRIFFMDRVRIEDLHADWRVIDLWDVDWAALAWPQPDAGQVIAIEGGWLIGNLGLTDFGTRLIVRSDLVGAILARLIQLDGDSVSPEIYQLERLRRGLPGPASELSDAYTPLETGLASLVAEGKGCYTGQEVLARQFNYDKISRHLVGILLQAAPGSNSSVLVADKTVGEITSSAILPQGG